MAKIQITQTDQMVINALKRREHIPHQFVSEATQRRTVKRLVKNGLVEERGGEFRLTELGEKAYQLSPWSRL